MSRVVAVSALVAAAVAAQVITLLNLARIPEATRPALAEHPTERVFIESWEGTAHSLLVFTGGLSFVLGVMLVGAALVAARWRPGGETFVISVLALLWAPVIVVLQPFNEFITSGEPDGYVLTEDHFPAGHQVLLACLGGVMVLSAMVAMVALVLLRRLLRT